MLDDEKLRFSRRILLAGGVTLVGSSITGTASAGAGISVITNKGNSEDPSMADLAAIFTTRRQSWSGGKRIVPFNFPPKHDLRVMFDRTVLGMGPDAVARYWIDRRIRGGNAPPKQISSAPIILKLIEKLDGAIAYVPSSAVNGSVRVIREL